MRVLRFLAILCPLILACPPLKAQEEDPRGRRLLEAGRVQYDRGAYARAEVFFRASLAFAPDDGDRRAWLGLAYLRQDKAAEAARELARAVERGGRVPDLELERARAAFALQRYDEALASLERFESTDPGRWEPAELRGLAHFERGEDHEASRWLSTALERGAPRRPVLEWHLARADERRGEAEAARERYGRLVAGNPGSTFGEDASRRLAALDHEAADVAGLPEAPREPGEDEGKPWTIRLTLAGGYNDNVILRGEDQVLGSEISRQEDGVFHESLLTSYVFRPLERTSLVVSNVVGWTQYTELHEFETVSVNPQMSFNYAFSTEWRAQVGAGYLDTWVDEDRFQNQWDFEGKVVWRPSPAPWAETVLAYTHSRFDFFPSVPSVFERDGFSNSIRLTQRIHVPGTYLDLALGYVHTWTTTEGTQFDRDTDTIDFEIGHPIPVVDVDVFGTFRYTFTRYHHTALGVPGNRHRRDQTLAAGVVLSRRIVEHVRVFASFEYLDQQSNIDTFQFDRHQYLMGVVIEF